MTTGIDEAAAAFAAYRTLRGLDRADAGRALRWIASRLDADQRTREAAQYPVIEPTDWIVGGQVEGPSYPSREELIANEGGYGGVIEVIGRAAVRQHFAVMVLVDEGYKARWFDDRAAAETYFTSTVQEPT